MLSGRCSTSLSTGSTGFQIGSAELEGYVAGEAAGATETALGGSFGTGGKENAPCKGGRRLCMKAMVEAKDGYTRNHVVLEPKLQPLKEIAWAVQGISDHRARAHLQKNTCHCSTFC